MIPLIASQRWHNLQLVTLMFLLPLFTVALQPTPSSNDHPKQAASQRKSCFPNSQQATPDNITTLMRQTGQVNPSKAAIGVPTTCLCQHGFPQAFAMDPLFANRINSGLLKLTCPILVRAIDELEDSGIMETLNEELLQSDDNRMLEEMNERHAIHAKVRHDLLSKKELDHIPSKLGEQGTKAFLEAGVAGASPAVPKKDVKCLHAWLADALFMDEENTRIMGDRITHELAAASLLPSFNEGESDLRKRLRADLSGTPDCHVFCNPTASEGLADPPKPRNKQRLRTGKEIGRRKRRKQEQQHEKINDNKRND